MFSCVTELCSCFEGPGPFPGLLDLWGGGGRLVEYRAALLASHGFAALALDYLTPKVAIETGKMVNNDYIEVNERQTSPTRSTQKTVLRNVASRGQGFSRNRPWA